MSKWAQLSPLARAYEKAHQADSGEFSRLNSRIRDIEDVQYKRRRNRYYQLLGHWCKLKKANDAQSI